MNFKKLKRKGTMLALIATNLVLLTGCGNKLNIEYIENNAFEYGSSLTACDLVDKINNQEVTSEMRQDGKIFYKNKEISCESLNTTNLGENISYLSYKNQLYPVIYNIIDTESPKIFSDSDIFLDENNGFNLDDYIKVTDNQNVIYSTDGDVDTSVSGIYEVIISAIDDSGNLSQQGVKIHVGNDETNRSNYSSLDYDNSQRQEAANKAAEKLKEQLAELQKEKEEIDEENKGSVTQEEIDELKKETISDVLTPNCKEGEYEIEADSNNNALDKAYAEYDCLTVKVSPSQEEIVDEEGNVIQQKKYLIVCGCPAIMK